MAFLVIPISLNDVPHIWTEGVAFDKKYDAFNYLFRIHCQERQLDPRLVDAHFQMWRMNHGQQPIQIISIVNESHYQRAYNSFINWQNHIPSRRGQATMNAWNALPQLLNR